MVKAILGQRKRNSLGITPEEIAMCVAVLGKLEPGFLPKEIFAQIARLVRLPMVDVIPIQEIAGKLSLGLIQRNNDDLWWPGMWHLPGTVLRSTDTLDQAILRVLDEEVRIKTSNSPSFVGFVVHHTKRGAEVVLVHTVANCTLAPHSLVTWFDVNELPLSFVDSERDVVAKLQQFLKVTAK